MAQEISLVGSWRLVSFAVRPEVGEPVFPFGQDADGCIIYAEGGRFSVQLRRRDRPRFIEPDQLKGSPSEIEASFKGYIAYQLPAGNWQVQEAAAAGSARRRTRTQISEQARCSRASNRAERRS